MKCRRKQTAHGAFPAIAGLALALVGAAGPAPAQDVGLPIGDRPEPIQLEDLDGDAVDLGEYIGEGPVLLQFWASWCPLCEEMEPSMRAAHERFGDRVAFLIVAVGVNQRPATVRRHIEEHPLVGRVLWDGRGDAVRTFAAPTTSYVVVLDETGAVAYTGAGGDQDIEAALARVLDATDEDGRER